MPFTEAQLQRAREAKPKPELDGSGSQERRDAAIAWVASWDWKAARPHTDFSRFWRQAKKDWAKLQEALANARPTSGAGSSSTDAVELVDSPRGQEHGKALHTPPAVQRSSAQPVGKVRRRLEPDTDAEMPYGIEQSFEVGAAIQELGRILAATMRDEDDSYQWATDYFMAEKEYDKACEAPKVAHIALERACCHLDLPLSTPLVPCPRTDGSVYDEDDFDSHIEPS